MTSFDFLQGFWKIWIQHEHFVITMSSTCWVWNEHGSGNFRCYIKIVFLKNFAKFTGKHLCQSLFATLLKKRLWHRFFCEFCEIFKSTFLTEHLRSTASKWTWNCLYQLKVTKRELEKYLMTTIITKLCAYIFNICFTKILAKVDVNV